MSFRHLAALPLAAALTLAATEASAQDCTPPRILFVVDASSSMLGAIGNTTKWQAAQDAVTAVLTTYPNNAEYGLMPFPGSPGQCTTGQVIVDVALNTDQTILQELSALNIPNNAQTPAGQTLMEAATYAKITDPNYNNYVIFVTDGYQYCSLNNGTSCNTQSDCTLMGESTCPSCLPDTNDGCYCVQHWPVLGAQALAAAGVDTYVVGFGSNVNFQALNRTADAGGTGLPNCDKDSQMASCYFQATVPSELTAALQQIVQQVVVDSCMNTCNTAGERTCTPTGWTECDAPDMVSCMSTCNTPGSQTCANGMLSECSSESDCGGGGMGPTGAGGAGGTTSGNGGAGNSIPSRTGDPEDDGSCGCRIVGGDDSRSHAWLLLLGLAGFGVRRRRR
jgi:MYXO-CTERM domain-containing protein